MRRIVLWPAVGAALAATIIGAVAASGTPGPGTPRGFLMNLNGPLRAGVANKYLSSAPLSRYWLQHPDLAPPQLQGAFKQARQVMSGGAQEQGHVVTGPASTSPKTSSAAAVQFNYRFNNETEGYPQNEESLSKCSTGILGGANDYRGFMSTEVGGNGDGTGWYYSATSGASLQKMGFLPGVTAGGEYLPSGGDPANAAVSTGNGCVFYESSLNYDPNTDTPSSIELYRTTKATLDGSCSTSATCWPTHKLAVLYTNGDFADKAWIAANDSYVVVVYTHFMAATVTVRAIVCNAALTTCGSPIQLSSPVDYSTNDYYQFPYVSIQPGTNTAWVNWIYWASQGDTPPFYYAKIMGRSISLSGTATVTLGPLVHVATETSPDLQGYALLEDMWPRVATQAKGVKAAAGIGSASGRWFVVWDRCASTITSLGECANSNVRMSYSDDNGAHWTAPANLAATPGHEYFPSQPSIAGNDLVVAYYTTNYGRIQDGFNARNDVELKYTTDAGASPPVFGTQRVTSVSSDPFADWWFLSWQFIGDYMSAVTDPGTAYVSYNAENTKLPPPDWAAGSPEHPQHQQDNYLAGVTYP